MAKQDGPVLDMTPDGNFIDPPKPSLGGILMRLLLFGVALAIVAALFWATLLILPFLLLLGVIGYFTLRVQFSRFGQPK